MLIKAVLMSLAMLFAGTLAAETGVALEVIGNALRLNADLLGWIVASRFMGGVISNVFLMLLPPKKRVLPFLFAGVMLFVLGFLPLFRIAGFWGVFISGLLRGMTTSTIITVANVGVKLWFSHSPGRYASIVHGAFGVGLLALPVAAAPMLLRGASFQAVWSLAAAPAAGMLLVGMAVPIWQRLQRGGARNAAAQTADATYTDNAEGKTAVQSPQVSTHAQAAQPAMASPLISHVLVQTLAFLVVGVEAAILGWFPAALGTRSPANSEVLALLLAAGIILGRLFASIGSDTIGLRGYFFLSVAALLITAAVPTAASTAAFAVIHVLVVGLAMSAIFPTMAALAVRLFQNERVLVGIGLSAAAGGSVIPALIGYIALGYGKFAVAIGIVPALIVVLVNAGVLYWQQRKE